MKKGFFETALSALIYGFVPILASLTFTLGSNPINLVFYSNLFAIAILAVYLIINKICIKIEIIVLLKILVISVFGMFLTSYFLFISYIYIDVGTSTALHFLYPTFVFMIHKFIYKSKIHNHQKISVFLSLFSILFFINLNESNILFGLTYSIASALTYAFYIIMIEKWKISKMNSYVFSFYMSISIVIFMLIMNLTFSKLLVFDNLTIYSITLISSILSSIFAVILLKTGIQKLGSRIASMVCLIEPVSALVFGYIFLYEKISSKELIGVSFIMLSLYNLLRKVN